MVVVAAVAHVVVTEVVVEVVVVVTETTIMVIIRKIIAKESLKTLDVAKEEVVVAVTLRNLGREKNLPTMLNLSLHLSEKKKEWLKVA